MSFQTHLHPIVSIVVPCYNYEAFVAECLLSIQQQTFNEWECIVVDDGSSDNSKEKILPFTTDSRFHYVWQENGNVSAARNNGLSRAKGEFVINIDADDKIAPNFLSALLARIQQDPSLTLVYPEVELFGTAKGKWTLPDYSFHTLLVNNMIVASAMYRRADFVRLGGYDAAMVNGSEDWEFWIRLLAGNKKVAKEPLARLYYRIKPVSKNTDLLHSEEVRKNTYRYITRKHCSLYADYFESPLVLYHTLVKQERDYFDRPFQVWSERIMSKLKAKLKK